ncbi:PIR protein [Plasmodium vivax]|nr:PIR protein [Plasmodium vivax]
MSKCRSGSDTYLNHGCYTYLNDKFKNGKMGDSSLEYFKETCDNFTTKITEKSPYYPLLFDLIKHTSHDGVFTEANPSIACNFANYLLNDKLRNTDYQYKNISQYDIYQNFVKEFYTKKHNRYDKDKSCDVHIKHIEDNIFKRMVALYQLYDGYDGLIVPNQKVDSKECDKLGIFSSVFNEAARTHGNNDKELLTRLRDLKKLIEEKISSPFYNTCHTKIHFFRLPETSSTDHEKQDQALAREKEQTVPELKSPELLPKTQGTVSLLPEKIHVPRETEVPEVITHSRGQATVTTQMESHHSPGSVSLNPWESEKETRIYGSGTSHESMSSYLSGTFHRLGRSHAQKPEHSYLLVEKERGNNEGEIYQSDHRQPNSDAKEGGVSVILSSIGGVLGEVDPAPVLGVSGGMGVLFILFKYTPVGSFFGGRRGRFRQIPSSFRGFPPGDFANFQEYDGGSIGYSPMGISPFAE